jgi:redox-sensitive bicupin YhaK (pirin superfamily)
MDAVREHSAHPEENPTMSHPTSTKIPARPTIPRAILLKTAGRSYGPVRRLIDPSGLGMMLKPFVFLDLFEANAGNLQAFPVHPHSGIGTVSVVTKGNVRFDDLGSGKGTIAYGGFEWMRAGGGVWHGDEVTAGDSPSVQAVQLWVALPPELESGPSLSQFFEASSTPKIGPACLIIGKYAGVSSPAEAPSGITYLVVTLGPREAWTFRPPEGQSVAFLAVAQGSLELSEAVRAGELAAFEPGEIPILLEAGAGGAVFVLGAAVPHPHELVMGNYSIHTSADALRAGEARIEALRPR